LNENSFWIADLIKLQVKIPAEMKTLRHLFWGWRKQSKREMESSGWNTTWETFLDYREKDYVKTRKRWNNTSDRFSIVDDYLLTYDIKLSFQPANPYYL